MTYLLETWRLPSGWVVCVLFWRLRREDRSRQSTQSKVFEAAEIPKHGPGSGPSAPVDSARSPIDQPITVRPSAGRRGIRKAAGLIGQAAYKSLTVQAATRPPCTPFTSASNFQPRSLAAPRFLARDCYGSIAVPAIDMCLMTILP
jgi:hypothetical protein